MPEVTPANIKNVLVTKLNWTAASAKEVGELLGRLKEGRTFKGGAKTGLQDLFKRWKGNNKENNKNKIQLWKQKYNTTI